MERGVPLPNRLGGLLWGSVVSSPRGVLAGAPAENEFGAFCGRLKDADSNYLLNLFHYPRRARSALGVDTVLTLDVCMFVCLIGMT